MYIKDRCLFLFFWFFLFHFLAVWDSRKTICKIRKIYHADIWHFTYVNVHAHIREISIAHGVKCLLHTIIADTQIRLYMYHFSRYTFRSAANIAYILKIAFFIIVVPRIRIIRCRHSRFRHIISRHIRCYYRIVF